MSHLDLDLDIPLSIRSKNAVQTIQKLATDIVAEAQALETSGNMGDLSGLQDKLGKLNCQHSILALDKDNLVAGLIRQREVAAIAEHGDLA